ncbi:MAG: hypothetical protein ACI81R_001533 [Bradymonadia bacterium]|jgi:hypothetical protein
MNRSTLRLISPLVVIAFLQLACYKSYTITTDELEQLQSSNIAESVTLPTADGEVEVSVATPITLQIADGENHRLSPFNFTMNESNLIAPDYNLLVTRSNIEGARVQQFSKGRTIALIVGSIVAAGGLFAVVTLTAPEEQSF